jgi:hypothetical protein
MFESFSEQQLIAPVDFNADTLKWGLTNTAPNAATADFWDDITEISAGNGYTAGGITATSVSISRTGDTTKISADDAVLTATGAIGPFQYVVLYKSTGTASTSTLIAYWALASAITMANGDTFTIDINPTNGFLQAVV